MNACPARHRQQHGFIHSGFIEMMLVLWVLLALLNLALGKWVFATAMLGMLVGLLILGKYLAWRDTPRIGGLVHVNLGPHAGKEGILIGANETGTRLTVRLSSAEDPHPLEFMSYEVRRGHAMPPKGVVNLPLHTKVGNK